jgi:hypothetical protein
MNASPLTVIMPLFRQPNFLSMALYGLVTRSVTRPRILVVWSRREAYPETAPQIQDFLVDADRQVSRPYATVQDWIARHGDWATAHNIAFHEVTQMGLQLRDKLGSDYIDGTDSAYKINYGIELADTEYIVPNYDADFFPSHGWDAALLACMRRHDGPKHTWIPTHVQPRYFDWLWPSFDDIEESRALACTHLTWPVGDARHIVAEVQWDGLVKSLTSGREIIEPCGARREAHWNPQAFRTEEFREHIKGFPWGTGTDLEVDNIAGRAGFTKVSTYRSFILHKGWVAMPKEPHRV